MKKKAAGKAPTKVNSKPSDTKKGKSAQDELSQEELEKASGGTSLNYGSIHVEYKQQS